MIGNWLFDLFHIHQWEQINVWSDNFVIDAYNIKSINIQYVQVIDRCAKCGKLHGSLDRNIWPKK
jgi:hypothetical protein